MSLEFRADWPKQALCDARSGTCLEGEDQIIFEHDSEGLIRLHWMNPLPKPAWLQHGGYQCDMCLNPDIRLGYQHVTEDNARDHSKLLEQRTGYDLCAGCAAQHVAANQRKIKQWVHSVTFGWQSFRRFEDDQTDIRLYVRQAQNAAEIEVEGSGGLHCAVAVMSMEDELPKAWMSMGRKLAHVPQQAPLLLIGTRSASGILHLWDWSLPRRPV
ncbi:unnamed protein product [Durusdinium trenchii]|uniref:HNH endonuclease n=1 Tax=Durusdinium trenchii TaxID=1381693 RepID=A0ABP0NYJ6_9DINO